MPALFDIGANLTHESFAPDLSDVVSAASAVGVNQMMVTGASVKGSAEAVALADRFPGQLFATAGIHPHHASEATQAGLDQIAALLESPYVKAVGETGLDFFRNFSEPDLQTQSFDAHIQLAIQSGLPMFLHERDAHPYFAQQLAPHRPNLNNVVVHCFTGSEEALKAYLDLDCYIGITGWVCDERRGQHLHELLPLIPKDRLLIETDAPYLMPRTLKPKPKTRRNEPKNLAHIADYMATLLNVEVDELAEQTTQNAIRFFRL